MDTNYYSPSLNPSISHDFLFNDLSLENTKKFNEFFNNNQNDLHEPINLTIYKDFLNIIINKKTQSILEENPISYEQMDYFIDLAINHLKIGMIEQQHLQLSDNSIYTYLIQPFFSIKNEKLVSKYFEKLESIGINVYSQNYFLERHINCTDFYCALQHDLPNIAFKFYDNWSQSKKEMLFKDNPNPLHIPISYSKNPIDPTLLPKIKEIISDALKYNYINDIPTLYHLEGHSGKVNKIIYPLEYLVLFGQENTNNQALLELMIERKFKYVHETKKKRARDRKSLAHYVVKRNNFGFTEALLNSHPEWLNYMTYNGKNLLHLAGCKKTIEYLIKKGVDPTQRDNLGILPAVEILARGVFDQKKDLRDWAISYIKKNKISLDEQYLNHSLISLMQSRKLLMDEFKKLVKDQNKELTLNHYFMNIKLNNEVIIDKIKHIKLDEINHVDEQGKTLGHILWNNKRSHEFFYHYKNVLFYNLIENGLDINKPASYFNAKHKKEEISAFNLWLNFEHQSHQHTNSHIHAVMKKKNVTPKGLKFNPIEQETLYQKIVSSYNWENASGWNSACSQKLAFILYNDHPTESNYNEIRKACLPYILKLPKETLGEFIFFALKNSEYNWQKIQKTTPEILEKAIISPIYLKKFNTLCNLRKKRPYGDVSVLERALVYLEKNIMKDQFLSDNRKTNKNKIL